MVNFFMNTKNKNIWTVASLSIFVIALAFLVGQTTKSQDNQSKASGLSPCKACVGHVCSTIDNPPACSTSMNECSTNTQCGAVACTPSCGCAASTCRNSTCSNGCGGICSGTKTCGTTQQPTPTSTPTSKPVFVKCDGNGVQKSCSTIKCCSGYTSVKLDQGVTMCMCVPLKP